MIKEFTDQSEVSARPVGCMNQSEVSARPAGCYAVHGTSADFTAVTHY